MAIETLEVTTVIGCRNMCRFCPQKLLIGKYTKKERPFIMSLENFKLAIDKIPKHVRIDFSGMAEPWLNNACTEMVLYAHEKEHPIAVYTTCVGMKLEDIDKIKHINFDTFVIHLRDSRNYTNIPDTPEHKSIVDKALLEIKNKETMSMDTNFMHSRAGNVLGVEYYRIHGKLRCLDTSTPRRGILLPSGDVLLCCQDYGMEHILGNLFTDSYENIYNSEEYRRVVDSMVTLKDPILCRLCSYARRY